MIYSRLWIIPSAALFILTFNYDVTPSAGYHLRSNENSSTGFRTRGFESNFLSNHFKSALNSSRALEEAIYSDILKNLRNLIKTVSDPNVESIKKEYKPHDRRGSVDECESGNKTTLRKTNSRDPSTSSKIDVFLKGAGEKGSRTEFGNVAYENSTVYEKEYLLGYSGNPFGSRQPISGVVEVPEITPLEKGVGDPRKKRSVLHLYNMVLCTTGCNPFAYKGYGCYCGFLGSGFVVDGIDSYKHFKSTCRARVKDRKYTALPEETSVNCCKMHDWCYNSAGCPMFLEYFIPYLWQCHHHQPFCAIDHEYYGGPESCAQRLCECDRQLALCLRRYPCPTSKALCTSSPWRLLQNILML